MHRIIFRKKNIEKKIAHFRLKKRPEKEIDDNNENYTRKLYINES